MADGQLRTLGSLLRERGLDLNMHLFKNLTFPKNLCTSPNCSHITPGVITGVEVVEAELSLTDSRGPHCGILRSGGSLSPFSSNLFSPLSRLSTHVLSLSKDSSLLLAGHTPRWEAAWDRLLHPLPGALSASDANTEWVRKEIVTRKEELYADFIATLTQGSDHYISPTPLKEESLVFVSPVDFFLAAPSKIFVEEYYGASGMPGVLKVPARFIQPLAGVKARRRPQPKGFFSGWEPGAPDAWFLGSTRCQEPVPVSSAHTDGVLEIAAELVEHLGVKAALTAALTV